MSQSEINDRVDLFLKELFETRLSSMMQLRVKMEEIANAQRQEEQQYVQAIKDVLHRNIMERDIQKEREDTLSQQLSDLEKKCRTEYQEKLKAQVCKNPTILKQ